MLGTRGTLGQALWTVVGVGLCLLVAGSLAVNAQTGALNLGEYACYGSGGTPLIGLGFKVLDAGRYTDLDGKSRGTYAVNGDAVTFTGGHLDGQTGRNLKNGRFSLGMIGCEPWK